MNYNKSARKSLEEGTIFFLNQKRTVLTKMHAKLEIETSRIKCLSFHSNRTWLLAAFHSGEIIIYDYETGVAVQNYNDFNVPVRAIDFHKTEPLFAAGADDAVIRIYNYEKQRCIATFMEHLDYIRTVQLHSTQPFLVSASDDQTIRIWNYETRTCLTSISGHNHYVMSAFFHPELPLVISASLDDTVRVWDVSSLFNQNSSPSGIFSLTDAVIKFQQEDHVSGVNWASWHPNKQMAISCSDDQSIKIWRVTESEMSIIATLRGHSGNVSSAVFHPVLDVIISCSEDYTVRVWDAKRYVHLTKFKRNDDRFWTVSSHPTLPIFAAGHDSGLVIFKLSKISPTFDVCGDNIFYYKENQIHQYNITSQTDVICGVTKPCPTGSRSSPLDPPPLKFAYNQSHNALLVGHTNKFEIHIVNESSTSEGVSSNGRNPVWVSRNQFAFLDEKPKTLYVREINGTTATPINIPDCRLIFPGLTGTVFIASDEVLYHFDVMRRTIISSLTISGARKVYVSPSKKYVSILTQFTACIATIGLNKIASTQEATKLKTGAWHDNVFCYATRTHIKYLLPSGDSSIIRSTNERLYPAYVGDGFIISLTTDLTFSRIEIDLRECRFKEAVSTNNIPKIIEILNGAKLCSSSIIDYIEKHGHPDIALQFATEPEQKFKLAIKSGNLEVAVETANKLGKQSAWEDLADAALMQGRFSVAEAALKKSGNQERLLFFYLISGQAKKLNSMKCDETLALQRAIWTNDRATESALLRDVAPTLSYIAHKTSDAVEVEIDPEVAATLDKYATNDLKPIAIPENESVEDWPLLNVSRPKYSFKADEKGVVQGHSDDDEAGWGDSDEEREQEMKVDSDEEIGDGWNTEDIAIDIPEGDGFHAEISTVVPAPEKSIEDKWAENCNVAGQLAAAGQVAYALSTLTTQIGLVNAEPLKYYVIAAYISAHTGLELLANGPNMSIPLQRPFGRNICPIPSFSLEYMRQQIAAGEQATKEGKFSSSKDIFLELLQRIPLTSCSTKADANEVMAAITKCRNYIIGMTLGIKANELKGKGDVRQVEYASYFSSIPLEQNHQRLAIVNATKIAVGLQCFKTASILATRITNPTGKTLNLVNKVNKIPTESKKDALQVNYNPFGQFEVCCAEFVQIQRGTQKVFCPFCGATYKKDHQGETCSICQLSKVGGEATGLVLVNQLSKESNE